MSRYKDEHAQRPGTVTGLTGIIFQSDGKSTIGRIFIRPLEALDRWLVGLVPKPGRPSLAMHAGIRVTIDGSRDFVAEQLVGTWDLTFRNGLNWTPYDAFKDRDRGGWDLTIPATDFRNISTHEVDETVKHLNAIQGHPFVGEDCTEFIERAFSGRRLFADSPLLQIFGVGGRIGDPALPLLKPNANLDDKGRDLLQSDAIKDLPDPRADAGSPNVRIWLIRLAPVALVAWLLGHTLGGRRLTRELRAGRDWLPTLRVSS
ncbi:MAG: hypothetical protein NVSMB2_14910 [Chloroflexota bacterium]